MENLVAREAENKKGEIDLKLQNHIVRLVFGVGKAMSMPSVISRWLDIWRLWVESLGVLRPVVQTRSWM